MLRLMRKSLRLHDAIAALLPGLPEAEHVRQVRAILLTSAKRVMSDA
ncbi:hypothetical protein [Methylobacterium sp. J-077]|nr:hypothetical protein [Methylobacterium sp. J-077]MCJ2121348.1 hypothetical protein [Methylobacterium sp. J-077]